MLQSTPLSRKRPASGADSMPLMLPEQNVGLHQRRLDLDAGYLRQTVGKITSVGVVVGEAIDHLVQGDDARGRDDADLPHAAADHAPVTARRAMKSPLPQSTEPDRRGQTLREAERHAYRRPRASSFGVVSSAMAALKMRAPSTCSAAPASCAMAATSAV